MTATINLQTLHNDYVKAMNKIEACRFTDETGISREIATRFQVGLAQEIQFNSGRSQVPRWTVPMRDAEGNICGIHLRSPDGKKCSVPGSKNGLFYECGEERYPCGWVAVRDLSSVCPICGEPEGCAVSGDDPDDPSAVNCVREQSGSVGATANGFLHKLKPDSPFFPFKHPDNDRPVFIVEGFTDAAAAAQIGLSAIGIPGAGQGGDRLSAMLKDYRGPIRVLGENDKNAAGEKSMLKITQILSQVVPDVKACLPPTGINDLRDWIKSGATAEEILQYVEAHCREVSKRPRKKYTHTDSYRKSHKDSQSGLQDMTYDTLAEYWISTEHTAMDGTRLLHKYKGDWYRWNGIVYELFTEADMKLYQWASKVGPIEMGGQKRPVVWTATRTHDLLKAAAALCSISPKSIPSWIGEKPDDQPDPRDIVVFDNLWINAKAYAQTESLEAAALSPTPKLFILHSPGYDFDQTATCPKWQAFLASTFDNDQPKINLIQEWFGYCLTPDMSYEKMLFMIGPSRAGKGVILTVLHGLVGRGACISTTASQVAGIHGLQDFPGKRVASIGDSVVSWDKHAQGALENILHIVGNDPVPINKKYGTIDTTMLTTRFMIASNNLPRMGDGADAFGQRLLWLVFPKSFEGKEDITLKTALTTELPGIAVWALEGLSRLRECKQFSVPFDHDHVVHTWKREGNPVYAFLEDTCDRDKTRSVNIDPLFSAWLEWRSDHGVRRRYSQEGFIHRVNIILKNSLFRPDATHIQGISPKPDSSYFRQ